MLGCDAAERVLQKANEAVNRDLLDEALEELITRVDDWKSHRVEAFGKLLLHGVYGVITGKSEQEKDVSWPQLPEERHCGISTLTETPVRDIPVRVHLAVLQGGLCVQEQGQKGQDAVFGPQIPQQERKAPAQGQDIHE